MSVRDLQALKKSLEGEEIYLCFDWHALFFKCAKLFNDKVKSNEMEQTKAIMDFHQQRRGNYTIYELVNEILLEAAGKPLLRRPRHFRETLDSSTMLERLASGIDQTVVTFTSQLYVEAE